MLRKYLFLFKGHIFILIILIVLIIISSITKGSTAVITSTLAGVLMIYAAVTMLIYIIRTPAKKTKEEVV